MKRAALPHVAISASAGSGKTFRLAHRYIRLLAGGVPAERICALTFSRKAAGEIFESIVARLCAAATDPAELALTKAAAGLPSLAAADCVRLLRALVSGLHRLHVGTLDSFTVGVVRAFPLELGVPGEFRLMDEQGVEAADVRRQVLERVLDPWQSAPSSQRELLEAFKQATFGREEKGLGDRLDRYVETLRERYRVLPSAACWGDEARIWPDGSPWLRPVDDVGGCARTVRARAAELGWPEKVAQRWAVFADAAAAFRPGSGWTRDIEYLFEKLAAVAGGLARGEAEVKIERTACHLPKDLCRAVHALVQHVTWCELTAAIQSTRGIQRLLELYEALYEARAVRQGFLSFSDVQHLLTTGNRFSGGKVISRDRDDEGRLYIDYRLDCQLDHWMLDEFQDTSDLQWSALENLADEILQDASGGRSFFYVGDVKQAIYGWRGGNARLFRAILDKYRGIVTEEHLDISQRSCPAVLDMVNRAFGDLSGCGLPESAGRRWSAIWREHKSAPRLQGAAGFACLVEPECGGDGAKPEAGDRYRVAAALLREIDPVRRGLTAAVLVRRNESGREVVDCLRRECPGLPVVHEGNASIADSPAVTVLLSLLTYAAHPGHTLARGHLQMSPLRDACGDWGTLPARVLRDAEECGLRAVLARWGREFERAGALDPFGRQRLDDLLAAAAEFDAAGPRDVSAFVRLAESRQTRQAATASAVRVMTIHQAKGLGFDLVILPDLMGDAIDKAGAPDFLTARDPATGRPLWTLKAPRRLVAEVDAVLAAQYAAADEEAALDALCVLYVAMTRPKRALYAITSFPGKTSKRLNEAALLKRQLLGADAAEAAGSVFRFPSSVADGPPARLLWSCGEREWYASERARPLLPKGPPPAPAPLAASRPAPPLLKRVEPSGQEDVSMRASRLFLPESRDIVAFGSAIHALLEQVEWSETADADAILGAWRPPVVSAEVLRDVERQFRSVLARPEARAALARPSGPAILWREKSFEIVLPGYEWVSGMFDRVVILGEALDCATGAVILDYKSSLVVDEADVARKLAEYRPQIELYARALGRMLKLPPERVRRQILFTRTGAVREV